VRKYVEGYNTFLVGGETIVVDCIDSKSEVGVLLTQPLHDLKKETPPHVVHLMEVEQMIDTWVVEVVLH
jgi:Ni,Fe-hydrogenase maturation factor